VKAGSPLKDLWQSWEHGAFQAPWHALSIQAAQRERCLTGGLHLEHRSQATPKFGTAFEASCKLKGADGSKWQHYNSTCHIIKKVTNHIQGHKEVPRKISAWFTCRVSICAVSSRFCLNCQPDLAAESKMFWALRRDAHWSSTGLRKTGSLHESNIARCPS
jgi:hypothetical protein